MAKSIKEERYNVELSDYSGSIVDEDSFDKKSDAIKWANDNGRNCYARIWDNEEGKTVKEWKIKSIKESVDKTFFDWMCSKDFFNEVSKQITKKEKCKFDFVKIFNSYAWLITCNDNFEDECLQINMDLRTKDITMYVNKNGKSGKDFKFPQLTFDDSVDELLDIIIRYVQGNFDSSWYESKKFARKSIRESKSSSILDDDFYDLIEQGYIYDEDENGRNMSYGEYFAVSDYLWETLENELEYYRDFPSAYDAYNEIMDNTSDDAKMFMGVSDDDYFYFEINEDENTYSFSGEVPTVLEKLFKKFLKETDFERV